ncbi:hypothetical protein WN944_000805 [Citrus x changshan-huyou]|uniref:Uncharacterized protein n=1 Tax=Citrus x changshan-huyou TaxID=2935761 RepID=A0AAP0QQS1_9ROSI
MKKVDPGIDFQCPVVSGHGSGHSTKQVSEIRIGTSFLRLSTITSSHHLSFIDGDAVLTVTAPFPPRTAKHSRHSSVRQRALHCLVSFSAAATARRRPPP